MKIAAVVPAYNESEAIASVVNELNSLAKTQPVNLTVIVVNDCSTDATGEIIDTLDCIALHLPVNLGIGGAVQTGFRYAYENDFDYAVQVDGDGQHPADEIPQLVAFAEANACDVVIGSRFIDKNGFQSTGMRRAGINYFSRLNRWLTGITVSDTTSGFRLLNRKALNFVNENYPDEYPEPEAIVLYARHGMKIGEVPVKMRERRGGVSSINSVRAIYYMWKVTLACLFSRIRKPGTTHHI
ncbi:MAG TPA: glycosyltransferase family 2 protein [Bacteroidia bacterium]|nr:glycosyltransferase family 2 protein [Bacteroidia bacterium]